MTITSYFMGGLYEETRAVAGQAPGVTTKYSAVAGMTVAMRDSSGLKYLLTDHLGSVVAVTDDGGTLISHSLRSRYLPFGGLRVSVGNSPRVTQTDHAHTGQRAADERTPRRSD